MIAAAAGNYEFMNQLLTAGASFQEANAEGMTAILSACAHGRIAVLLALLRAKAPIDQANHLTGMTPLMYAAQANSEACVVALLHFGANRRLRDSKGRCACDLTESNDIRDALLSPRPLSV